MYVFPKAAIVADWRKTTCKAVSLGIHKKKGITFLIFFHVLLWRLFLPPAASAEDAQAFDPPAEQPASLMLMLTLTLLVRALTSGTCVGETGPAADEIIRLL